jgi:hypothetical protein
MRNISPNEMTRRKTTTVSTQKITVGAAPKIPAMAKPSTSRLCRVVTWRQPLVCMASPSSTKAPIPARIG